MASEKDVIVDVRERKNDSLELGIGASTRAGVFVSCAAACFAVRASARCVGAPRALWTVTAGLSGPQVAARMDRDTHVLRSDPFRIVRE
ncbi:MAG: hypothetical protein RIT81_31045 [Deltaproteobacteria bacterium]